MSYGFQPGYKPGALEGGQGQPPPYSGPPPPYQPGAPQQPGAPFQPFGAPPFQSGAPQFQPGAPPFQPGAPPYEPQAGFQQGFPPPAYSQARSAVIRHSGTGLALDAAEYEIKLQSYNGSPTQIWFLEPASAGRFFIKNKANGAVIDIEGGPDCGANLITYEKHGGDNQQWYINNADNTILCSTGNLAIDVYEGNCYPGNFLIAYDRHGGPNQQFRIEYQS